MGKNLKKRSTPRKQAVRIRQLKKIFSPFTEPLVAIEGLSLDIEKGEVAVILGPSGCGKSTLIRMIAGLEKPTSGSIKVNGKPVERPLLECSMVFQSYTSFPWLSVIDNIAFGLRYTKKKMIPEERKEKARSFAKLVGLEKFENAFINTLSGGMKQRVAIASALATEPEILIMDEPFGALDYHTRMAMQEELMGIVKKDDKTVIFVTHDIDEALLLGDRVYICTERPAEILTDMDVPLPYPRTIDTRKLKTFFEKKNEILNYVRDYHFGQKVEKKSAKRREKRRGEKK